MKNKILIIEDSKTQATKLEYLLNTSGYEVGVASNGIEALDMLQRQMFDLIISDIVMPGMDGFEICEKIKTTDKFKSIPVILLTTLDKIEDVMRGLSKGADNYISKPYDEKFLLYQIEKILLNNTVNLSGQTGKLEVNLGGETFEFEPNPEKILNYFMSSYYASMQMNKTLQKTNAALEELSINLERRVIKRTSQLEAEVERHKETLKELRIALDKTRKLDQLKTEFMQNLSHEIRTPMNSIIGFTELFVEKEMEGEELLDFLPYISKSLDTLLRIITDLIEAAETMTGYIELRKAECTLPELFNDLVNNNLDNTLVKEKNSTISFLLDKTLENQPIITYPDKIKIILAKLLSNAIKYTDNGQIEIGAHFADNDMISFHVKDNGIGIAEENFNEIFECFKQLEENEGDKYSGTGVGLSIANKLVEVLGGKIWLESKPGAGTTFYFTVPYFNNPETSSIKKTEAPVEERKVDLDNLTILLAEDVKANFLVIKAITEIKNMKLLWAQNGQEALDLYEKNHDNIDLVLMDIQMPVMDGNEATRRIKQKFPDAFIIALTAYGTDLAYNGFKKKGFNAFIKKPVRPSKLMEIIRKELAVSK